MRTPVPNRRRLVTDYFEPPRVPPEVAHRSGAPDTLPSGSPAKVGILDLAFARSARRTELVERYQKTPLQLMRPLYIDPHLPGMAFPYLMATGGGIAQADRYRMDFDCGPSTEVHFTTQAATKVYRMEHDYAAQQLHLKAGPGAYVEYLPDPVIPFAGSRFYQRTVVTVAEDATVLLGETLTAGRLARGERHAYDVLATDVEVRRPDGTLLVLDTQRLEPGRDPVTGPGVFLGHSLMASLFVLTDRCPPDRLADALLAALHPYGELRHGVSVLPGDCGAWVRALGDRPQVVASAQHALWDAARRLLTGTPAPELRKP